MIRATYDSPKGPIPVTVIEDKKTEVVVIRSQNLPLAWSSGKGGFRPMYEITVDRSRITRWEDEEWIDDDDGQPEEADPFSPCLHQGTTTTHEEFIPGIGPCDWDECDDCGARL